VDAFEKFKWNLLANAHEDWQLVPEALWSLAGDEAGIDRPKAVQVTLAERALRDLHDVGFIFFFRDPRGVPDPVTLLTPVDTTDRLSAGEVDSLLREEWWHGPGPYPPIYFGATDAGDAAVKDPPEFFRSTWSF
jgi:hypothetical protein